MDKHPEVYFELKKTIYFIFWNHTLNFSSKFIIGENQQRLGALAIDE